MYNYEVELFNKYNHEDDEILSPISERERKEFYDSLSDETIMWICEH